MPFQQSAAITPRAPKTEFIPVCACSNSCEKVLELLFSNNEKLTFEEKQLTFNLPFNQNNINLESKFMIFNTKNICNSIIVNRNLSLADRLILIGKVLQEIQQSLENKRLINFDTILNDITYHNEITLQQDYKNDEFFSFELQKKIVSYFSNRSENIQKFADNSLKLFSGLNQFELYQNAKKQLYLTFPNIEIMMEKIIHNYMIYEQFPFSKQVKTFFDEFESLCGVYLFVQFITIGYMIEKTNIKDFIDVISSAFRLINHTSFNRNINILLTNENIKTVDQLASLIK